MNRLRWTALLYTLVLLLAAGCIVPGESEPETGAEEPRSKTPEATETAPDPREVGANEAGLIMVLEYHRVGGDSDFAPEWTISPEDFRGQLRFLYDNDYYPINFRDLLEHDIDVPAGKTPVVLTFDDSSDTQFTMIREGDEWVPDPESAVGILADFHEENPDWPMAATFFVLPAADPPNDLFGQPELSEEKLRYLVDNGMEVGTHTLYHANLATSTDEEVQRQLARSIQEINEYIPDYEVVSLSLPFGEYPQNESLLRSGSHEGFEYELKGAAEVAGGATYPPGDRRFDPFRVPRIQAEPEKEEAPGFFQYFEENPGERYVSDGDPDTVSFPSGAGEELDRAALEAAGKTVREY
jgi:peptidoglycan/xylan/chitin deacetylase (PgdA/CDA1 family)